MTFREFLTSDPGKAMLALLLTAILIICPVAAGWLAASYTLTYAVDRLRRSFARLEAEEAAERRRQLEADQQVAAGLQRLDGDAAGGLEGSHATENHPADRLAAGRDCRLPVAR